MESSGKIGNIPPKEGIILGSGDARVTYVGRLLVDVCKSGYFLGVMSALGYMNIKKLVFHF